MQGAICLSRQQASKSARESRDYSVKMSFTSFAFAIVPLIGTRVAIRESAIRVSITENWSASASTSAGWSHRACLEQAGKKSDVDAYMTYIYPTSIGHSSAGSYCRQVAALRREITALALTRPDSPTPVEAFSRSFARTASNVSRNDRATTNRITNRFAPSTRHTTHGTRYTVHDTRHTTHDTRHTTHDARHTTYVISPPAKHDRLRVESVRAISAILRALGDREYGVTVPVRNNGWTRSYGTG